MTIAFRALVLLALAAPAGAQNTVDACRTGRVLENRPVRLSILPTNGSAPIELLLRYRGCRTADSEPLERIWTPPTAVRTYRADGIAWEVDFYTEDGKDSTDFYIYYNAPRTKDRYPVAHFNRGRTQAIAAGRVDWGIGLFMNFSPPEFDFKARVVTQ